MYVYIRVSFYACTYIVFHLYDVYIYVHVYIYVYIYTCMKYSARSTAVDRQLQCRPRWLPLWFAGILAHYGSQVCIYNVYIMYIYIYIYIYIFIYIYIYIYGMSVSYMTLLYMHMCVQMLSITPCTTTHPNWAACPSPWASCQGPGPWAPGSHWARSINQSINHSLNQSIRV